MRRHGFVSFVPKDSKQLLVLERRIAETAYAGQRRAEPVAPHEAASADAVLALSRDAMATAAAATPAVLSGDFVECAAFAGARAGYAFRSTDDRGVGYYAEKGEACVEVPTDDVRASGATE